MSFITDLFSGGAGKFVDSVGQVFDNVITTREEKGQLDNEIKKAELQYQLDMKKLSNEERQMMLGDMASARNRDAIVQTSEQSTRLNKNLMPLLALGTILVVMALFFILVFTPSVIKAESKDIIIYILGVLSAVLTQIYSYYFGSSASSADKQKFINSVKTP
jgi:predicted aconitase